MITHSGVENDETFIPRYVMNTAAMNLSGGNTLTREAAQRLIRRAQKAGQSVLAQSNSKKEGILSLLQ